MLDVQSDGTTITFGTSATDDTAAIRPSGDGWAGNLPESGLLGIQDGDGCAGNAMQPVRPKGGSTTSVGSWRSTGPR